MKTADEIVAYLAMRIGLIYHHSGRMYGGNADGVDLLLWFYHETWAEVMERTRDLRRTRDQALDEQNCEAANFPTRYRRDNAEASDEEITTYVVAQWKKISERLEVPIPHAQLTAEFERWIP